MDRIAFVHASHRVAEANLRGEPLEAALRQFLHETASSPEAPARRLRRLAVWLEHENRPTWSRLSTIYDLALDYTDEDAWIWHSLGLAAQSYAEAAYRDPVAEHALRQRAIEAMGRAIVLAPDEARVWHGLGACLYAAGHIEDAADAFRRALRCDSIVLSKLHLAYCYHDLGAWRRALESYWAIDDIDESRIWPAFRRWQLREARAYCALRLGMIARAEREFLDLLDHLHQLDIDRLGAEVGSLDMLIEVAARGPLRPALVELTRQLLERHPMLRYHARRLEGSTTP